MKAVFVDGASLHHMGHAIGIARFNFVELHELLVQCGEVHTLASPALVTIPTSLAGNSVIKAYRTAGFEVLQVTTAQSADDQAIIDRIRKLSSRHVREVVIVSTDQDFVPVLREKFAEGMKVIWVGCSAKGRQGSDLMSSDLKSVLKRDFTFVDIASFEDKVVGKPLVAPAGPKPPIRNLKIELSGAQSSDEYLAVVTQLTRLLRRSPHIKYKI